MNYSLLAIPQAVTDNLKYIFIGVCAFAGLIALISGLIKGFYRTSRRWIKFAAVLAAFFFAYRKYAEKINFEKGALKDKIPPALQTAVLELGFLLAAILAVNIVFGIIDAIVKHCAIKKMKSGVAMSRNSNPKLRKIEQKRIDKKWKPNAFSRLCGGVPRVYFRACAFYLLADSRACRRFAFKLFHGVTRKIISVSRGLCAGRVGYSRDRFHFVLRLSFGHAERRALDYDDVRNSGGNFVRGVFAVFRVGGYE